MDDAAGKGSTAKASVATSAAAPRVAAATHATPMIQLSPQNANPQQQQQQQQQSDGEVSTTRMQPTLPSRESDVAQTAAARKLSVSAYLTESDSDLDDDARRVLEQRALAETKAKAGAKVQPKLPPPALPSTGRESPSFPSILPLPPKLPPDAFRNHNPTEVATYKWPGKAHPKGVSRPKPAPPVVPMSQKE